MTKKHYILLPSPLHESYQVKFKDGATEIGPTINITIEANDCTPVSLMWLNSRGGFDTYAFNPKRDEELEVLKGLSKRQSNSLTSSQSLVDGIESAKNGILVSDYLDRDTLEILADLIESPIVYLVHLDNGSYNYVPVIIQTKKLPKVSRSLIKVEIEYRIAFERLNQNSLNVQPLIPGSSDTVEWQNLWS